MKDYNWEVASAAEVYLQRKAVDRKVRDAAIDAIRMIAAGCADPAGRAQAVLDMEVRLDRARRGPPPAGASAMREARNVPSGSSGADVRE